MDALEVFRRRASWINARLAAHGECVVEYSDDPVLDRWIGVLDSTYYDNPSPRHDSYRPTLCPVLRIGSDEAGPTITGDQYGVEANPEDQEAIRAFLNGEGRGLGGVCCCGQEMG